MGDICDVTLHGSRVKLLKPATFMNNSGKSVNAVTKYFQIAPVSLLVVHDEIDLPAGQLRFKTSGGHGGHNGLRDISTHLNTSNFMRLRIGVGHPGSKELVEGYVLRVPEKGESDLIAAAIKKAEEEIPRIMDGEFAAVMNALHRRERVEGKVGE